MSDVRAAKLRHEVRGILEQQLAANDPPEVAPTFARLRAAGIPEDEVWRHVSAVLLTEMNAMMRDRRPFDATRYAAGLAALPRRTEW